MNEFVYGVLRNNGYFKFFWNCVLNNYLYVKLDKYIEYECGFFCVIKEVFVFDWLIFFYGRKVVKLYIILVSII